VFRIITNRNWQIYAARHYNNPNCTGENEFFEDLYKVRSIKKLIARYTNTRNINVVQILNNMILVTNVFGINSGTELIVHQFTMTKVCIDDQIPLLKSFLVFLKYIEPRSKVGKLDFSQVASDKELDTILSSMGRSYHAEF
jgi:hypothetical protein